MLPTVAINLLATKQYIQISDFVCEYFIFLKKVPLFSRYKKKLNLIYET